MTYDRVYPAIPVITIVLLCLVYVNDGQLDRSVCIPHQQPALQPRFKVPGNFSTRIECQLIHKNLTINVEEFHDQNRARGLLVITKMGITSKVIYSNQDMQILFVKNGECSVFPIPIDIHNVLMWMTLPDTGVKLFTTTGLLTMTRNFPFISGPAQRIRGLLTNTWNTCIYLDVHNVTFSITLFFTNSRYWKVSSAAFESLVLARAEVVGRFAAPNTRDFHMIYDYYDYNPDAVLDDILFQPDPGIYCPGRLGGPKMPVFPSTFHLTTENIDKQSNNVSNHEVTFDHSRKLAKDIEKKLDITAPFYLSTVYDYFTGVKYTTDSRHDTCTASPITDRDLFSEANSNPVIMIPGAEYFMASHNNANTQHVGKRSSRGMICDVWIGVVFDIKLQRNITIEWYFAKTKIHLQSKRLLDSRADRIAGPRQGIQVASGILTRMDIWQMPGQMPTTHNFMNLDPSTPHLSDFDITECYSDLRRRLRFVIELHVTYGDSLNLNKNHLLDKLTTALTTVVYIRPIRIQQAQVLWRGSSEIYFVATLLDRAPFMNPFFQVPVGPSLRGAYSFMRGVILNGLPIEVSSTTGQLVSLRAVAIREVTLARELLTTRPPTTSSWAPTSPVSSTMQYVPTKVAMATPQTKSHMRTTVTTRQSSSTILTYGSYETKQNQPAGSTSELSTVTSLGTSETSMSTSIRPSTQSSSTAENVDYNVFSTSSKSISETSTSSRRIAETSSKTIPGTQTPAIQSTCTCPAAVTCPTVTCPVVTCPTVTCPTVTCPVVTCPIVTCPIVTCPVVRCSTVPLVSCMSPASPWESTAGDVSPSIPSKTTTQLPRTTISLCPLQDRETSNKIPEGIIVGVAIGGLVGGLLSGLLISWFIVRYRRHSRDGQSQLLLNFYINDDAKL